MVIEGIVASGMNSEEGSHLQGAVNMLFKVCKHIHRNKEKGNTPFSFRLRHLLPQSGTVQRLEKLKCAEQIF